MPEHYLLADATFVLDIDARARRASAGSRASDNVADHLRGLRLVLPQLAGGGAASPIPALRVLEALDVRRAATRRWRCRHGVALTANFRRLDYPFKLTFCITYWCNYNCQTCNIWKMKPRDELRLDEIQRVLPASRATSSGST